MKKKRGLLIKAPLIFAMLALKVSTVTAEYRAYMLEVYDFYDRTRWVLETGFSPTNML